MISITASQNTNGPVLRLSGAIDSSNAAEAEAQLNTLCPTPCNVVTLDAEELTYLSSAGLRVLLRMCRRIPGLSMINVTPEVFDVMEMTGFTELIPTRRALRRVSTDNCRLIAAGANGAVYRLDKETVLKVAVHSRLEDVIREKEMAKRAFVKGIPTAIAYDVVSVGDAYGAVYELIDSEPLSVELQKADGARREQLILGYADVVHTIHATRAGDMVLPSAKELAIRRLDDLQGVLPGNILARADALLSAVPESDTILHGDLHIRNIMVQGDDLLLIDMDTLSAGDPVFEYAQIYNTYRGFPMLDRAQAEEFMGLGSDMLAHIWDVVLRAYKPDADADTLRNIEERCELVGSLRLLRRTLNRGVTDSSAAGVEHLKARIIELTSRLSALKMP